MPDPSPIISNDANISMPIKGLYYLISTVFGAGAYAALLRFTQRGIKLEQRNIIRHLELVDKELSSISKDIVELRHAMDKTDTKYERTMDELNSLTKLIRDLHFDHDNNPKFITLNDYKDKRTQCQENFSTQLSSVKDDLRSVKSQNTEILRLVQNGPGRL